MVYLKLVHGMIPDDFLRQEDIIELKTPISIATLKTPEERKDGGWPEDALFGLMYNGTVTHVRAGDGAYLLNESGGTIRVIHNPTQRNVENRIVDGRPALVERT